MLTHYRGCILEIAYTYAFFMLHLDAAGHRGMHFGGC